MLLVNCYCIHFKFFSNRHFVFAGGPDRQYTHINTHTHTKAMGNGDWDEKETKHMPTIHDKIAKLLKYFYAWYFIALKLSCRNCFIKFMAMQWNSCTILSSIAGWLVGWLAYCKHTTHNDLTTILFFYFTSFARENSFSHELMPPNNGST